MADAAAKNIDPEAIVYRYFDFFELIDSVRRGQLRVGGVSSFEDKNDLLGVGLLEKFGELSLFPHSEEEIRSLTFSQKPEFHFISCWTETRDSIAMWELYSRRHHALQVGIQAKNVQAAFRSHFEKSGFHRARKLPPHAPGVFVFPLGSGYCEYCSFDTKFRDIVEAIRSNRAALDDALGNPAEFGEKFGDLQQQIKAIITTNPHLLKDEAYSHENEYRFCFMAYRRNEKSVEEIESHPMFPLIEPGLAPAGNDITNGQIHIEFDWSSSACILLDPRLPSWKVRCQQDILSGHGLKADQSTAYGFRPDNWTSV